MSSSRIHAAPALLSKGDFLHRRVTAERTTMIPPIVAQGKPLGIAHSGDSPHQQHARDGAPADAVHHRDYGSIK